MRQLWGEAEDADADVVREAVDVVAVDDVGAWVFNPSRLKPIITKEVRWLPKARAPKGGGRGGRGGGGYGNMENPYKNGIIGMHATVAALTYQGGTQAERVHGNPTRTIIRRHIHAWWLRHVCTTGWLPSRVGKHKKYLPIPGTEYGE